MMRRGGTDYWGHRGGEAYRGHGAQDSNDEKLEPVNLESDPYHSAIDRPQNLADPGPEDYSWDINNDEDDELQ
jgi:hypothetical protein